MFSNKHCDPSKKYYTVVVLIGALIVGWRKAIHTVLVAVRLLLLLIAITILTGYQSQREHVRVDNVRVLSVFVEDAHVDLLVEGDILAARP